MDQTQRALMRNTLLIQLHDAAPSAVPVGTLWQGAKLAGFDEVSQRDVERELGFAVDKGEAEAVPHAQSAGLKRWRLTAAGRDFLESEGLV
jgi:hypothetical protein